MTKPRCRGTRKDGSPCQGVPLEKYDGLCLAHGAPPEQAHQWRSSGGKNSAAAVRRDRRMPEYLKEAIDLIQNSMRQLAEKDPTPASLNAISRAAKTLIELRRFANEEMELIRTEEIQAAAAARLDVHTDLEVLEAAGGVRDQRDRCRRRQGPTGPLPAASGTNGTAAAANPSSTRASPNSWNRSGAARLPKSS